MTDKNAETLYLLYNSSEQILNSLYAVSKDLENNGFKPDFLQNKNLEPLFKKIAKKFPISADFIAKANCGEIIKIRHEIIKECQPYYNALLNLHLYKEAFCTLTTNMLNGAILDLILHPHISIMVLEVFVTVVKGILLMNLIQDRSVILGCYGIALLALNNSQENLYHCVCKLSNEYSDPYGKLNQEFFHLKRIFDVTLSCLVDEFRLCCSDGKQMQTSFYYNITGTPRNIAIPTHAHIPEMQFYGYLTYCAWFVYTSLVFPTNLMNTTLESVVLLILSMNVILTIHRDTYIFPHAEFIKLIESNKTLNKKMKQINDSHQTASANFISFHKERRDYFAETLHETRLIIQDKPGLLGPKFDRVLQIMSLVSESVLYLCLHISAEVYKPKRNNELFDPNIFSMIYDLYLLKNLILRYSSVIQRYYISFIGGYDLSAMEHIKTIKDIILNDPNSVDYKCYEGFKLLCETLKANPTDTSYESSDMFLGMRLDWMRMQIRSSTGNRNLCDNTESCCYVNNLYFHTKAIDSIKQLTNQCAPIHNLWFFNHVFTQLYNQFINIPGSVRYISIVFGIYSDFNTNSEQLCSVERCPYAKLCFANIDEKLHSLANACGEAFTSLFQSFNEINKTQFGHTSSILWLQRFSDSKKGLANRLRLPIPEYPGSETHQVLKDETNEISQRFFFLQEFCETLSLFKTVQILDHHFYPKMVLVPILETCIKTQIMNFMKMIEIPFEKTTILCPRRPSHLLIFIDNMQQIIASVGAQLDINLDCLLYSCLMSLNIPRESSNSLGIASTYAWWFTEIFAEIDFISGNIIYADIRKSFICKSSASFRADEFTDVGELRALTKVIGAHGVKTIIDAFNRYIATHMSTIKKFLSTFNSQAFIVSVKGLTCMDNSFKKDKNVEEVIGILVRLGAISKLKTLILEAFRCTIEETSPNLDIALKYWQIKSTSKDENVVKLFNSLGYDSTFDLELIDLFSQTVTMDESDRQIWFDSFICLLPLTVGYIAARATLEYVSQVESFTNNLHLVVDFVKNIFPQIFYNYRAKEPNCMENCMKQLCHVLCLEIIRVYNGSLVSTPVLNKDCYFQILVMLIKDNVLLNESMIEKIIPSALLVSITDKLIRLKGVNRASKG